MQPGVQHKTVLQLDQSLITHSGLKHLDGDTHDYLKAVIVDAG